MKTIRSAILLFLFFTVLLGGGYPALVTGCARLFFPNRAGGSIITDHDGRAVGSALIGQPFTGSRYFLPRPSATAGHAYNPLASGGSNLGPTNPLFLKQVEARINELQAAGIEAPVPSDLVLASASGLDPHITPTAAAAQIPRVAAARGISRHELRKLVDSRLEDRQWGIFGEPRVNVLLLNLDLDRRAP